LYVQKLSAFAKFLSHSSRSLDEICKYLVLVSFENLAPKAMYIGEVTSEGFIEMRTSFGFKPAYIGQWGSIPITAHIPLTQAIATDKCIVISSKIQFFEEYPDVSSLGTISGDWNTCIAVPLNSQGAYFLVLNGTPDSGDDFDQFLSGVGSLILIHLRERITIPVHKVKGALQELSNRQGLIKNLLERGFTNHEIAEEIGYSESLVRQETIAIYSHLGISGRKELIEKYIVSSSG